MKTLSGALLLLILAACNGDGTTVCNDTDGCSPQSTPAIGGNPAPSQSGSTTPDNSNPAPANPNNELASGLTARHTSGQTFLTWNEPNTSASYHVYRSSQPITTDNLASATLLTNRWGPIDPDSSIHKHGTDDVPAYFVIEDLGAPLDFNTGLFVHTTQNNQSGNTYYAVTTVANGSENKTIINGVNNTTSAINESVSTPKPVLTVSLNGGKGRIYTQYMDYANWNPTLNGYAFNYAVAVPFDYSPSRSYPLQVQLHAYGSKPTVVSQSEFDWQVIQLFPTDPGEAQNTLHTWWYGHAADHNYLTSGNTPTSGRVENYTEQRLIHAINEVIANPDFNVNRELIHAYGNSMGASGAVSLAMRYPSVFAGTYASQPMTNYASSPLFQNDFVQLWGSQSANLPIVNRGPQADAITRYSQGGDRATRVWDWMNHQQQLSTRRADNFAFMMMDFGKEDTTIDWFTQGRPMPQALTNGKAAFTATALDGIGHNWLAFNAVNRNQFGLGDDTLAPWRYPNSLSYVALQFASGSGSLQPGTAATDEYNTNLEWSTPQNSFHQNITDSNNRYEISLRSLAFNQTVSVTPRNTQAFKPAAGRLCNWTATRNSNNTLIASGSLTVDDSALATAVSVPVVTGTGTRLAINCN